MSQILHTYLTNWAFNSGIMDSNGIRWLWAIHEDPRFSSDSHSDDQYYGENEYYGPDYNFNDGDW